MIKLSIKDLEARLGKSIKRNFVSIGIDTATTTGIGIISANEKEVEIDWTLLQFEASSQIELYKQMYHEFQNMIDESVDFVVVENVFLGMNPDVTIKLARFGGLAMACAINKSCNFATIGASSARAKLFKMDKKAYKGKSKEAVADYLKSIGIEVKENNCADGVILALLGIIDGLDFRSNAEIAEEKKLTKKLKKKKKVKK